MSSDVIQKILKEHKELLSLPQTLSEVLRVSRDEKSSAQALAAVLMKDPALTVKVLRIANSPYYGVGREITTMTQAVVTLGMRTVTALALSTSVYRVTGGWKSSIDRNRFWRHSLEVAISARMIAEAVKHQPAEEAFVSGLLHDIGILVLEGSFQTQYAQMLQKKRPDESLVDLETEVWGTDHARVAKFLLEQWSLPQRICDAVGLHHMTYPPDGRNPELELPQIVNLANLTSRFPVSEKAVRNSGLTTENKENLCKILGLKPETLADIEAQLFSRTVNEAKYMEIEIGSVDDLLMEANRLLFEQYMTVENLLRDNRRMQAQIARDQMKKLALESLKTITATFNHYMNNATATILGRAQLVEYAITKGQIHDPDGQLATAMQVISGGVNTISRVMEELKNLAAFETTVYHTETQILDIENRLKKQLQSLEKTTSEPVTA